MLNFEYYCPTKIIFGKGKENEVGSIVKQYGKKILLHYGGGSVIRSGLLDRVKASLDKEKIEYVELGGVQPNPRLSLINEGIKLVKEHNIDFILAVGGGSVIDSAKGIGLGSKYDGDLWDIYLRKATPVDHTPVGVILTIPAAGSEMSTSAVITNEVTQEKRGYNTVFNRPVFSILNPELIYTVPKYHLAAGIVDMFAHVVERYFTNTTNVTVTDNLCLGVMNAIYTCGSKYINDVTNYDLAAEVMWAASMAHNGILDPGRLTDWSSHAMEHSLSAYYDISHGGGLAVIIPAWMKYVYKHNPAIFAKYAEAVFGVEKQGTDEEKALLGIQKTIEFFESLGLPTKLSAYNIEEAKFEEMAKHACVFGPIGNFVKLHEEDIVKIYKSAL
jgi:alcohol dehydrogenase YqhD (iron-dependent ADH family)